MNNAILKQRNVNFKQKNVQDFPAGLSFSNTYTNRSLDSSFFGDVFDSFQYLTDSKSINWHNDLVPRDKSRKARLQHIVPYADGGNSVAQRIQWVDEFTGDVLPMKSPFHDDHGTPLYTKKGKSIDGTKTNSMKTLRSKLNLIDYSKVDSMIAYTFTVQGDWKECHDWWNSVVKRFRRKLDYWLDIQIPKNREHNTILSKHDWSKFCGVWDKEYQVRGAQHLHVVFFNTPKGTDSVTDTQALHAFGRKMNDLWYTSLYNTKELRERNKDNFINGQDWDYVKDAQGVIAYLSNYLTGSKGLNGYKKYIAEMHSQGKNIKQTIPDWVIKSKKGSRSWGYFRMKTFQALLKTEAPEVSKMASLEVKKSQFREMYKRIFNTSMVKGKSPVMRVGRTHEFNVFGMYQIEEPELGAWKKSKYKKHRKFDFYRDDNGDPKITHKIQKCFETNKYILFDLDGVVLSEFNNLSNYRVLTNHMFVRNSTMLMPIGQVLEECPTLAKEFKEQGIEVIDVRTQFADKKLVTYESKSKVA